MRVSLALAILALSSLACGVGVILEPGDVAEPGPNGFTGACPPTATEFGLELGDVVPDLELMDCDGSPVGLHELCAHKAAYFFIYNDW